MRRTYIYIIKNIVNDKVYIGRTVNFSDRFYRHKSRACRPRNKEYGSVLYNAIRKYGENNFTFKVLIVCEDKDAPYYESSLISLYKSTNKNLGYNVLDGTEESISHSQIVRDKISASLKRFYAINGSPKTGVHHSKLTKERISLARRGRCSPLLYDHLLKQNNARNKKVVISTTDNAFVGEYISINDAARKLGLDESCLSKVCLGKRKQHNGYIARYVKNFIEPKPPEIR